VSTLTCHTPECPSDGVPVVAEIGWTDSDTGEQRYPDTVVCGACGQPIEDVDHGEDVATPNDSA
jgi:hypothetical protein